MRKIRIGVDLDGVLGNLLEAWLDLYNNDFHDSLIPEDITEWDIRKFIKPEARDKMFSYLDDEYLYENVNLVDDYSVNVLKNFMDSHKYEVFIVTSCGNRSNMIEAKINWLKKHFPFLKDRNFVFTDNKGVVAVDFLIDDYPLNLRTMNKMNPDCNLLLYDAPHNQTSEGYFRVNNWKEVETVINFYQYTSMEKS